MKKCLLVLLILSLSGGTGWYVSKIEKDLGAVEQHAISNSMMGNRNTMMLQMFFDTAPEEIMRMIRMNRCQCGHDTPARTIALSKD